MRDELTPAGCVPAGKIPECKQGLSATEDPFALRGHRHKQKYGTSLFYPIDRYVDGVRAPKLPDRKGHPVNNPLYSDLSCGTGERCLPARDPALVFYAQVVGVPRQDLAVDPHDLSHGYLTAKELKDRGQWGKILPPWPRVMPLADGDPLMIESVASRSGENPFTHERIPPPNADGTSDSIHGHEWDPVAARSLDMQHACTFPLSARRMLAPCSGAGML